MSWPLCFADEGRSAVDLAGGAQIVAEHIKSLSQNTEPENEKLLTVFCGMLMNYSNDNGNDHFPQRTTVNSSQLISGCSIFNTQIVAFDLTRRLVSSLVLTGLSLVISTMFFVAFLTSPLRKCVIITCYKPPFKPSSYFLLSLCPRVCAVSRLSR